jgi:hypothetical protein
VASAKFRKGLWPQGSRVFLFLARSLPLTRGRRGFVVKSIGSPPSLRVIEVYFIGLWPYPPSLFELWRTRGIRLRFFTRRHRAAQRRSLIIHKVISPHRPDSKNRAFFRKRQDRIPIQGGKHFSDLKRGYGLQAGEDAGLPPLNATSAG